MAEKEPFETTDRAQMSTVQASTVERSRSDTADTVRETPRFPEALPLPGRYEDLGPIASGGSGDVRRVRDRVLERIAAMKLLRLEHVGSERMRARFLAEAHLTAQLDHPGIVAVHDRGELPDGRLWYVMKEVRGRTLGQVIHEVHATKTPETFHEAPSGWTFRRLIDAFARVAQAVAYAHDRGIFHRDLKPDNLMVGLHGEVLVMDWGLARRSGKPEEESPDSADPLSPDSALPGAGLTQPNLTQIGDILGTPAYMPPEQARGRRDLHGPRSDVYALGAILYCMLAGVRPYHGRTGLAVWRAVIAGPPEPLESITRGGPPLPFELIAIAERAMQREIEARHRDAGELAREIVWWLDGAQRREQALSLIEKARKGQPEIATLYEREAREREQARALLGEIKPYEPVEKKRPGWEREDQAAQVRRAAILRETEWLQEIHGALSLDAELPEAHAMLADHYSERLLEAERTHQEDDAARFESLLRAHDRGRHTAILRGDGAVTLVTDVEGAEVVAEKYVLRDRRLVAEPHAVLGKTPLREAVLPRGSYLLKIRAKGREEVRYPVLIERGGHWDGCAPGEKEPFPIGLPLIGDLGEDDCYVPAGWCWIGGDPQATDSLPGQRVWIDAFVMKRFPVTSREYLAFLNFLMARGREAEALAACPRASLEAAHNGEGRIAFGRDAAGQFELAAESAGVEWEPELPAVLIDWHGALGHAHWIAAQTNLPWRLPNELEREKAARGVDGRSVPWGDHLDATFARVAEGNEGPASRETVDGHPTDESAYGVMGLAGNVRDWCVNVWKREGPPIENHRLRIESVTADDSLFRTIKGGTWGSSIANSRSAGRFGGQPGLRSMGVGLRLLRGYAR